MFPTLLKIGPITLHSYGLMLAIGFLLALTLVKRECRKAGIDPTVVSDMAFWGLLVGLAGSRLLYIVMYRSQFSWSDPIGWIAVWEGGLVFHGAAIAGIVFCCIYLRHKKIPIWPLSDIAMSYFPLGHAIGRLGCFLKGCCYGERTDMPWGIPFRRVPWDVTKPMEGSPAFEDHCLRYGLSTHEHWSYPIHPTQLYSFLGLLSVSLLLIYLRKKWNPFPGFVMPLYLCLYGVLRFIVENFRGDHNPTHFGPLTDQQAISIALVVLGATMFIILKRTSKKNLL